MRSYLILLILLLGSFPGFAQGQKVVDNEALLTEYLNKTRFDIDTTAQAVVLYESAYAYLVDGNLEYHLERTIKILGNDPIADLSRVDVQGGRYTTISKIVGATYNLEDGKIIKQPLATDDILKEKVTDGLKVSKVNLPGVKVGSIIHYDYTITRPEWVMVPDWNFQGSYPKLYSEYEISLPLYIVYTPLERMNVLMRQVDRRRQLEDDKCVACSFSETFSNRKTNHKWVRRNVPAFKREPYMSSSDNFKERVKIQVTAFNLQGRTEGFLNNWKDLSRKLYIEGEDDCGQVFSNNGFLEEKTNALTAGKTTELEKAKAIFAYVRNNTDAKRRTTGSKVSDNIRSVYDNKEGTVAGVNLLLTAMLRKAGLSSFPIVLSSRDNERLNPLFPDPGSVNYYISKLTVDGKDYFLDASVKQMPFGSIPYDCYNGYCRMVNKEDGADVELDPNNIVNKSTEIVSLSPFEGDSKKLLLKVEHQFGTYSGLDLREEWSKDTSLARKKVIQQLTNGNYHAALRNFKIKNADNPDEKLAIEYEALLDLDMDAGTIYFDPYLYKFFDKNPFSANTRKYPVEMDYQEDINYIFRMQLPANYTVDDYPKSTQINFGEDALLSLKNLFTYTEENKSFTLNSRFSTKATYFSPEIYPDLHKYYESMIEEQNKKIVLKRITN